MNRYLNQVQRGMEWLDKVRPGWIGLINLETLKIRDLSNCVLSQVGGGGMDGWDEMRSEFRRTTNDAMTPAYGFDLWGFGEENDKNYPVLQDCWVEEIQKRMNECLASD